MVKHHSRLSSFFTTCPTLIFCGGFFLVHQDPRGQQEWFLAAYRRNLSVVICLDLDWMGYTRHDYVGTELAFFFQTEAGLTPLLRPGKLTSCLLFICQPARIHFIFIFIHLIAIQVSIHNFLCPAFSSVEHSEE